MNESDHTEITGSPSSKNIATSVGNASFYEFNNEDIPDFCSKCTHCSTTIKKVIEYT
jgi:hypothetical protein